MSKLNDITGRIWEKGKTGDGNITEEMQELKALMLELIGEDREVDTSIYRSNADNMVADWYNELKAELRQKVEAL